MSKPATRKPRTTIPVKRNLQRQKTISSMIEQVTKYIKKNLGKDVKVPEDLKNGVAAVEILNKIAPKTAIQNYTAEPKDDAAAVENFKAVCTHLH